MSPPVTAAGRRRHVLLLRGINVGRHHKVPMADLRDLLSGLGYQRVRTLLNSGNAVFDLATASAPRRLAAAIEAAMDDRFGFRPRAFVLAAGAIDTVVAENTLADVGDNPSRLMVTFYSDAADGRKVMPLARQSWGREALAVGSTAAYVWCPNSILDSPLFEAVSRALGTAITTRNWATTLKLQAACREG